MAAAARSTPRNTFALLASRRRASTFHDRRAPRGGSRNWGRELLDELDDERLDAAPPVNQGPPSSQPA